MIDFHSHILPGMDDGSKSTQESLEMLDMLRAQGVDTVAATPHFYARENPPEVFSAPGRGLESAAAPTDGRQSPGAPGSRGPLFPGHQPCGPAA